LIVYVLSVNTGLISLQRTSRKTYGDGWVIITGASDGIGKAFTEELLSKDLKVLMIARNKQKLEDVRAEMVQKFPKARLAYEIYDFNRNYNEKDIIELKERLIKYDDVSILINNVGVLKMDLLERIANEDINQMININCTSVAHITKIVAEKMNKREKSLIVTVSSGGAIHKYPYSNVYAATKCFDEGFSQSMRHDYTNIDFTLLFTGPVETNIGQGTQAKLPFTVSAKAYAQSAVKHFGKYNTTTGSPTHHIKDTIYGSFLVRGFILNMIKKKFNDLLKEEGAKSKKN